MSSQLDPISLEILANGLRSVADECFVALMRSSYSTNIKERKDHSITIVDKQGRLVVQAKLTLPIHIASMGGLMQCVLEKFRGDIHEGDIFVANDPPHGRQHASARYQLCDADFYSRPTRCFYL